MKRPHRERIIRRLARVAEELGELREQMMLVGGSVPALLDMPSVDVRPTDDVDLVLQAGYGEWAKLQATLREHDFEHRPDAHACKMVKGDLELDVMPTNVAGLGTNRWYEEAFPRRVLHAASGFWVMTPVYFVATKLAAFQAPDREHGGDFRASRDLEDIVLVLFAISELRTGIAQGKDDVHRFIRFELKETLAAHADALEILAGHLGFRDAEDRAAELLGWMKTLGA